MGRFDNVPQDSITGQDTGARMLDYQKHIVKR